MKQFRLFFLLFLPAILLAFSSCDKNDDDVKSYAYGVGTIMKNESNNYFLDLDSNKKLLLSDSTVINYYKSKEGDRILASFYLLDQRAEGYDYVVEMFDLYKILTKPIITLTPEITDSIGNDPTQITKMWIHEDLLSIEFKFKGTGNIQHMINLVTTEYTQTLEPGYAALEFRHNLEDDRQVHVYTGIVSFKLGEFAPSASDLKGLRIKVKTFHEGDKTYKLDYKDECSSYSNNPMEKHVDLGTLVK